MLLFPCLLRVRRLKKIKANETSLNHMKAVSLKEAKERQEVHYIIDKYLPHR